MVCTDFRAARTTIGPKAKLTIARSGNGAWRRPRGTPMARRIKTPSDEYLLGTLTWLFLGLVVVSAIAGLFSELTH
jgi:hypothetical protein